MPDRAARALNAPAERERSARGLPPNIRMKTGSWPTALPDGHIRIGTSRGTTRVRNGQGLPDVSQAEPRALVQPRGRRGVPRATAMEQATWQSS